ncbi:SHOCT domain-containing protein [Paractinoplanes rhizophilus]|uniref:SHOCT domain-containing protein n=1 Tax=Paractinoplanes rhizophilus TaxID=1416877 RepID=A0ABW2I1Z0_9ACTN|nr:SHOCT domain-containing protein [Actinoplanes sp.]
MGLLRGMARTAVVAGTATAVSNRVSRRQAGRWQRQADQEEANAYYEQAHQQQQAPPPPAPAAAPAGDDMQAKLDALKQLGDLKAQGVLTEQEFQQQKARILGS